ncbi:MAG: hypothetical protein HQK79_09450 [Desulfobacterales bacterium]|nr:hypothetical protein [Desulfobacterales bacterium]MBF0397021.1 hypothetical protein [Desulfobacterales bacterium]
MILHAEVSKNGILKTPIPNFLWGKRILIQEIEEESGWKKIEHIFEEADKLDFPRKTHEDILMDLKTYKETG